MIPRTFFSLFAVLALRSASALGQEPDASPPAPAATEAPTENNEPSRNEGAGEPPPSNEPPPGAPHEPGDATGEGDVTPAEPTDSDAPPAEGPAEAPEDEAPADPPENDDSSEAPDGAPATATPAQPDTGKAAGESTQEAPAEEPPPEPSSGAEPDSAEKKLETPFARQGEFVALGAHAGFATADDADYGWRKLSVGPAFTLRVGEALNRYVDLGLEFGLGLQKGAEKLSSGRLIAHGRFYPLERLFVHAGFGFGVAGGPDPEDPAFKRFRYGDVYVLGLGTNLYLRDRNRSGGPMFSPSVTFELGPEKDFTTAVLWIGAEFSWWAGLRRDQLELPLGEAYQRAPVDGP